MNRTAVGDAPVLPPHPRAQTSLNTEALDQSNRKCEVGVVVGEPDYWHRGSR